MELTAELVLVFFLAIAIFNGLGLMAILNISPRRSAANIFLTLLLFFNICPFFEYAFTFFRLEPPAEFFMRLTLLFSDGPLFWLYLLYASGFRERFSRKDMRHFIPMLIMIPVLIFTEATGIGTLPAAGESLTDLIGTALEDLYNLGYFIVSGLFIIRLRKESREVSSTDSLLLLRFQLLFLIMCAIPLYSLFELCCISLSIPIPVMIDRMSILFETLLIQTTALYLIIRPERKKEIQEMTGTERKIKEDVKKYGSSQMNDILLERYGDRLNCILEEETPYLKTELSIADLAKRLDLSVHQLSQLINSRFQTNFYGLINRLRIEEAKSLLGGSDLTVMEVAFESGFNSKTTFNRVFKELTGETPSQFRKKVV
jgi:AraC-like DNA-binding protein